MRPACRGKTRTIQVFELANIVGSRKRDKWYIKRGKEVDKRNNVF